MTHLSLLPPWIYCTARRYGWRPLQRTGESCGLSCVFRSRLDVALRIQDFDLADGAEVTGKTLGHLWRRLLLPTLNAGQAALADVNRQRDIAQFLCGLLSGFSERGNHGSQNSCLRCKNQAAGCCLS